MSRGILGAMQDGPTQTVEEYVAIERFSNLKHEYYDGQIRAMSGGTPEHSRLAAVIIRLLGNQLVNKPCTVYTSDLRVRIGATGLITYPDASVYCAKPSADSEDHLAQLNPTVLFEVTSKSSETYDRGGKFEHYKLISTLREYVIVSHREHAIEVFRRGADGTWALGQCGGSGERVQLESISCELDVDEIYFDPRRTSS